MTTTGDIWARMAELAEQSVQATQIGGGTELTTFDGRKFARALREEAAKEREPRTPPPAAEVRPSEDCKAVVDELDVAAASAVANLANLNLEVAESLVRIGARIVLSHLVRRSALGRPVNASTVHQLYVGVQLESSLPPRRGQ